METDGHMPRHAELLCGDESVGMLRLVFAVPRRSTEGTVEVYMCRGGALLPYLLHVPPPTAPSLHLKTWMDSTGVARCFCAAICAARRILIESRAKVPRVACGVEALPVESIAS